MLLLPRLFALLLTLPLMPAWALQNGQTERGWPYVSGGASAEELAALRGQRERYSLWITTAAKTSGAHIADVRIAIRDSARAVVFDGKLDGPWFFIDLPPGRYELEATLKGQTQRRQASIGGSKDRQQAVFYFDTGDTLAPEAEASSPARGGAGKSR